MYLITLLYIARYIQCNNILVMFCVLMNNIGQ